MGQIPRINFLSFSVYFSCSDFVCCSNFCFWDMRIINVLVTVLFNITKT
jgi:hypothetical protein